MRIHKSSKRYNRNIGFLLGVAELTKYRKRNSARLIDISIGCKTMVQNLGRKSVEKVLLAKLKSIEKQERVIRIKDFILQTLER